MHSTPPAISLLLFVSLYYISTIGTVEGKAVWTCEPCRSNGRGGCIDDPPVDYCMWGETRNFCGQRVCAKGPGERCGGPKEIFGRCGAQMWCQKEKENHSYTCHGCFRDSSSECYHEED